MLQSKKRTERKWRQRTTRNHILQLEHLYKAHPARLTTQTKTVFPQVLEDTIRSGRMVTVRYLERGTENTLTGTVTALFHARGIIEIKTSTGLRRHIPYNEVMDIRELLL
ncbi:YolD-like family protein [Exiguobacterium artemiae]|uniref:YolD-like family protein n=1 Tax=Exiguobacterium artemiae TaxID=340145 RepID=UPI003CFF2995